MSFRFKQFTVNHSKSSMKTGTDAVLLGIWADFENSQNLLDVGTGCGVISLIAAQKNQKLKITAIDIDKNSSDESAQNFKNSKWAERLNSLNISLHDFSEIYSEKFEHIICNPPFFSNSTPSPKESRHFARHTDKLKPKDFFEDCFKILAPEGKISIIIPTSESVVWIENSIVFGFSINNKTEVFAYPNKNSERTILEFSFEQKTFEKTEIFIRTGKNLNYTEQYIEFTKDFYLDLLSSQR